MGATENYEVAGKENYEFAGRKNPRGSCPTTLTHHQPNPTFRKTLEENHEIENNF